MDHAERTKVVHVRDREIEPLRLELLQQLLVRDLRLAGLDGDSREVAEDGEVHAHLELERLAGERSLHSR